MGSHCQILDDILSDLQRQGVLVKFFPVGSNGGLRAVKRGDCDLTGMHMYDPESNTYNTPFLSDEVFLIKGYQRSQGFVFREDDSRFNQTRNQSPSQFIQAATADTELMMINGNQGSGTRILIDRLLQTSDSAQPNGYEIQVTNHHAVCAAVSRGQVDWGISIQTIAEQEGLGFAAIENEQFDFVVSKSRYNQTLIQKFEQALKRFQ